MKAKEASEAAAKDAQNEEEYREAVE